VLYTVRMQAHGATWPMIAAGALALCACRATTTGMPPPHPPNTDLRRVEAPTAPVERAALAELPAMRSDRVELAVAFPGRFDPAQEHPILITQVTSDRARSNIAELAVYAPTALALGYVVLTAQGIPWPTTERSDTLAHRYASVRAALRWLAGEVPQSEAWPIVLAGFSGGAKISQVLAFSLALEGRRVAGAFLGGCNEDHSRLLLREYPQVQQPFSQMAFFLSVGEEDRIAPPASVREVADHLRRSGARRLQLSVHRGGHRLDTRDLDKALRWLRAPPPRSGSSDGRRPTSAAREGMPASAS
jgi:predicted esterase